METLAARIHKYLYLACCYSRFAFRKQILSMPLYIQVQTNSACNGNCVFCPYPEVSRSLPQGSMDNRLYARIVNEISRSRIPTRLIFDLHNEPLIDSRALRMIKDFKNSNPDKKCRMVTNGLLIDRYLEEDFVNSGVDQ